MIFAVFRFRFFVNTVTNSTSINTPAHATAPYIFAIVISPLRYADAAAPYFAGYCSIFAIDDADMLIFTFSYVIDALMPLFADAMSFRHFSSLFQSAPRCCRLLPRYDADIIFADAAFAIIALGIFAITTPFRRRCYCCLRHYAAGLPCLMPCCLFSRHVFRQRFDSCLRLLLLCRRHY